MSIQPMPLFSSVILFSMLPPRAAAAAAVASLSTMNLPDDEPLEGDEEVAEDVDLQIISPTLIFHFHVQVQGC